MLYYSILCYSMKPIWTKGDHYRDSHGQNFIWGFDYEFTNYNIRQALALLLNDILPEGWTSSLLFEIQVCFEIIVGAIIVKSPYIIWTKGNHYRDACWQTYKHMFVCIQSLRKHASMPTLKAWRKTREIYLWLTLWRLRSADRFKLFQLFQYTSKLFWASLVSASLVNSSYDIIICMTISRISVIIIIITTIIINPHPWLENPSELKPPPARNQKPPPFKKVVPSN